MPLFIKIKHTFVLPTHLWLFCSSRSCLRVASHIPQSDIEDNHWFVFNCGCEENIEDISRAGAGLERDGSPQPGPCLQNLMDRLDASCSTKDSLLH